MEIIHLVLEKSDTYRLIGPNQIAYQLAEKQSEHGMNVSVWAITDTPFKNDIQHNFKTAFFKKPINPFSFGEELRESFLSKKGKAVFHLHGGWIPAFSKIAAFLGKHHIPYVFTPHGAYNVTSMRRGPYKKKIYFNLFEKKVLRYAHKIHCVGLSEMKGLSSIYKNQKAVLLPYGFSEEQPSTPHNFNYQDMIIGFVGHIDIYAKGLDLLVNAFARFNKLAPKTMLWIIGDGAGQEALSRLVKSKGLSHSVTFLGSTFMSKKDSVLKKIHALVYPSRGEGLPSVVLEAANMGVPSIVSEATNLARYVEGYHAGLAVRNDNEQDIMDALLQLHALWTKNELSEMGTNAQKMVREAFDWDQLVHQFSDLYP